MDDWLLGCSLPAPRARALSADPAGAHLFHGVTSFRIGYLALAGMRTPGSPDVLDLPWPLDQPVEKDTPEVRPEQR